MNRRVLLAGILLSTTLSAALLHTASAQTSSKKSSKTTSSSKGKPSPSAAAAASAAAVNATIKVNEGGIFTVDERDRIADYYRKNHAIITNVKPLPPGIAKNLLRGKPLPRGIAKTRLPKTLEASLPRHSGYERWQVGPDVVAVDRAGKLQDILKDVFHQ